MRFPGAMYGDALVSGEYVVMFAGSHIEFNGQRVAFPPGEPFGVLYPVLNATGQKFVGQAHDSGATVEYDGTWHTHPPANGTYGAAYDGADVLQIIAPGPNVTSQGYRYIGPDGQLVRGDATYLPNHGISQWTDLGDGFIVGQSHDGEGAVCWDGETLRQIADRFCWPVRARRSGENVVVTYTREGDGVNIWRGFLRELKSFPAVVSTPSTQPPNPNAEGNGNRNPTPTKSEPVPVSIPNQLSTVQRIRAKYPTPLGDQHGAFLIELAKAVGGFLYRKPGGDHTTLPDGTPVSLDIVIIKAADGAWWVDVLGDAEVNAVPSWDAHPNAEHPENFVDVSSVPQPNPGTPPPNPGTPPPQQDLSAILNSLAELRAAVAVVGQKVDAVSSKILPPVPPVPPSVTFPDYRGSVPYLGSITLKPVK